MMDLLSIVQTALLGNPLVQTVLYAAGFIFVIGILIYLVLDLLYMLSPWWKGNHLHQEIRAMNERKRREIAYRNYVRRRQMNREFRSRYYREYGSYRNQSRGRRRRSSGW